MGFREAPRNVDKTFSALLVLSEIREDTNFGKKANPVIISTRVTLKTNSDGEGGNNTIKSD